MKISFSQAEKLAIILFLLAVPLYALAPMFAAIPLSLFLLCCLIAPFSPQWGFFLPIISKSKTGCKGVTLTFDDGPCPASTPILLDLLDRFHFQATFFVIGEQAEKYPNLIADILARGHTIGNHSWQHDNLLMLRSKNRLRQDIRKTQELLMNSGIRSFIFRPPAGITNPRLKSILEDEGLITVTFSCRAFDGGNKKIANLAERIIRKLKPGDIILLHDLFSILDKNNYDVQPLETLINLPVMTVQVTNKQTYPQ
jgi:peptidoglycan/xylan/chitin deacetylase (PgdA/CDA1 family)